MASQATCPHLWTAISPNVDGTVKLTCRKCGINSRLSLDMFTELLEDSLMPVNTMMIGDTIFFNVGGPSPGWVCDLCDTPSGTHFLVGLLQSVISSHHN